jgi:hypothetical protein
MPDQEAGVRGGPAVKLQAKALLNVLKRVHLRQVHSVRIERGQPSADRRVQQQLPHGRLDRRGEHAVRAELQEADVGEADLGGEGAIGE